MTPMERDHQEWLITARRKNAKFIVNVCDTFDYDNYPVYVMPDEDLDDVVRKYSNKKNMQKIDAIVDVETGKVIRR